MGRTWWALVVVFLLWWTVAMFTSRPREVHGLFPDERVKWEVHDVSGFILKRPGVKTQMTLPTGTLLYIPHVAKPGYADSTSHSS